jgi:hypothetical protein
MVEARGTAKAGKDLVEVCTKTSRLDSPRSIHPTKLETYGKGASRCKDGLDLKEK